MVSAWACALCAATASAARVALESPPVITLDLASQGALQEVQSVGVDKDGKPCNSFAADADSCESGKIDKRVFFKFCEVGKDTAATCELPTANAHDHHEGTIPVTQSVFLHVASAKHAGPKVVDTKVPGNTIDFNQRGEYYIKYDAADTSGNKANTISFHVFMVDHTPPVITTPVVTPQGSDRFLVLPITATDDYDGDVTDVVKVQMTAPDGRSTTTSTLDAEEVKVDTLQHGMWTIEATARDFASAFGKDYADNVATKKGHVIVKDGQVTEYKFGDQTTTYEPEPTISPLEPTTPEPSRKHYVPPVLMLHFGQKMVARGSPFGRQHTEAAYRAHLIAKGVELSVVEQHVNEIIAREEKFAANNPAAAWKAGMQLNFGS